MEAATIINTNRFRQKGQRASNFHHVIRSIQSFASIDQRQVAEDNYTCVAVRGSLSRLFGGLRIASICVVMRATYGD